MKRPINLYTQHNCITENLSHKIFQWHDTSVDFITNRSIVMAEGEIITGQADRVAKSIENITTRGSHSEKAKPCHVTEIHEHAGRNHVHFVCRLPYADIDDMEDLLKQIIDIKKPF